MNIQIKSRWNDSVIWECDALCIKEAVCKASALKINLRGADLRDADLGGAHLVGTNLEGACLEGVNLRDANLRDVNLEGACLGGAYLGGVKLEGVNLRDADLEGACLGGAYIEGNLKILAIRQIAPIGSRSDFCTAFRTNKGLYFQAGCFFGSLDSFRTKVMETHGTTAHGADYADWIELCERWDSRNSE